ncbi:GH3 domain-containing protein isoform X2 [Narcine bancroftii]|uniref:GH3 domain-containing protein isoform X2 n=1 Tax=Narcine bancroftii TaxID=1343680 RepID=UPI0038312C2C
MILLAAFLIPTLLILVLIWSDICRKSPDQKRTYLSRLHQYLSQRYLILLSLWQRRTLEFSTKNVRQEQQRILLRRIRRDRNTEYGNLYRFSEITNRELYCRIHPLTEYGHYKDYIWQIGKGEENVLISERPRVLSVTSGTSGSTTILPSVKITTTTFQQGFGACFNAKFIAYPHTRNLQRTAKFFYPPVWKKSESGIPIGPNDISPTASQLGSSSYSTPAAGYEITTETEAQYIHLLFALKDGTLGFLEASFASILYHAFAFLQHHWEPLVEDIRLGRVNPQLSLADDVRLKLNAQLKPDPQRASQLAVEFVSGFRGIARRVWPQLNLVLAVDTGANKLYGSHLKHFFCEGVPTYSPIYAATEGLIGVNLWPERKEQHYLLCPQSLFYEFIPINLHEEEQPRTLFMDEVKENEVFELVVTNASGLCRYRIGDIVKVVAFHNQSPVIEFKYRKSQMLNVRGEKITEEDFYQTLQRAVKLWPGAVLLDYCCIESSLFGPFCGGSDPHYEVFVEIGGVRNLSEDQRYKLDQCLQEDSMVYQSFRRKGSIGPVRVHIVAMGSFKELTDFIIANVCIGKGCGCHVTALPPI